MSIDMTETAYITKRVMDMYKRSSTLGDRLRISQMLFELNNTVYKMVIDDTFAKVSSQDILHPSKPVKPAKKEPKVKTELVDRPRNRSGNFLEGFWYNRDSVAETARYEDAGLVGQQKAEDVNAQAHVIFLLKFAESKARENHYKGWSNCRICGKRNGSTDFTFGHWTWPNGYSHYIIEHDFIVTEDFAHFLLKTGKRSIKGRNYLDSNDVESIGDLPTREWIEPIKGRKKPALKRTKSK